jgi:phage terminase large subunit-like protein
MNAATQYATSVSNGTIQACQWVRLACERYLNDLKAYTFREDWAAHAVEFIEELEQWRGEFAGKRLMLEPWQKFIIYNIFGFEVNGRRRFGRAYVEVPRKNGKSTFAASIMLYGLVADGEAGAQVFSVATKMAQALIVFDEAAAMSRGSEILRGEVKIHDSVNSHRIIYEDSVFRPIEWGPTTNDGLNTHMATIDEYHAHKTDEMYNVIMNSMGARRQPFLFTITTAGFNKESPCYKHRTHCTNVLKGLVDDPTLFSIIYTLDETDDWTDPKLWRKANPNLSVSVQEKYLVDRLIEAKESNDKEVEFKTKLLNVWTDSAVTWINDRDWMQCAGLKERELEGMDCYAGLDLASTRDFCALSLFFPERDALLFYCWLPEDAITKRRDQVGQSYRQWVADGEINVTDGNVTDYRAIRDKIGRLRERFNILEFAYDKFNSSQLVIELTEDGLEMYPFRQGMLSMTAPSKEMERLVLNRRLQHTGHPVLRWMVANVMMKKDENDNVKPDKKKSGDKIDGAVSSIMAIGAAMENKAKERDDDELWFVPL